MNKIDKVQNVYFVGIGGIGMSAIARFFHLQGLKVAGYDRVETQLTKELQNEGIDVHFEDNIQCIDKAFKQKDSTLVVYTPAIPVGHDELNFFKKEGFTIKKRAEVLGLLTQKMEGVCVAGTHGKTTISTLTAHLFKQSEVGCNAFLGGISQNYNTNFLFDEDSNIVVVEADEFDRSFLQLTPHLALISAMDADHLDIYGNEESVVEAFEQFAQRIQSGGVLVMKEGLPLDDVDEDVEIFTYGMDSKSDFYPENISLVDGNYQFNLRSPLGKIVGLKMGIGGLLNVENAIGAMALAMLGGVEAHEIKVSLPKFKGIRRRFDYRVKSDKVVYIDDYAHHPEEIKATLSSVKAIYPNKKITVAFQPHLFTRTRDFVDGFALALDAADRVVLLDIYPARELPIAGVTSEIIAAKMKNKKVEICSLTDACQVILNQPLEVLLTLGAGDIDKIVPELEKQLG